MFVLGVFANDQPYSTYFYAHYRRILHACWRTERENSLRATTLISSFPSTLSHLFNYFIPLVIPVLAFAAFLKTCFGIGKRSRTDQCNRDCKHLCQDNPCGQPPHWRINSDKKCANCPIIRHGSIVLGKICETFFALARIAFWTAVRREDGCAKRRNNACHTRAAHRSIVDNLA